MKTLLGNAGELMSARRFWSAQICQISCAGCGLVGEPQQCNAIDLPWRLSDVEPYPTRVFSRHLSWKREGLGEVSRLRTLFSGSRPARLLRWISWRSLGWSFLVFRGRVEKEPKRLQRVVSFAWLWCVIWLWRRKRGRFSLHRFWRESLGGTLTLRCQCCIVFICGRRTGPGVKREAVSHSNRSCFGLIFVLFRFVFRLFRLVFWCVRVLWRKWRHHHPPTHPPHSLVLASLSTCSVFVVECWSNY